MNQKFDQCAKKGGFPNWVRELNPSSYNLSGHAGTSYNI